MADENKIRDVADAVKGVVEAVPIYQDVLQPAAKEVGTALQTVAKTIHIVLAPVSGLVWGYEQIKDFVATKVAEKLRDVPPENIATPKPNVAGPALESLRYTGHEETLRDMYANLLAASMDTRTANGAHPAFVEIIRQLTPDEAKITRLFAYDRPFPLLTVRREYKMETATERGGQDLLVHFSMLGYEAGCEYPQLTPAYIDNLCRLGLAEVPALLEYTAPGVYEPLENHAEVTALKQAFEKNEKWKINLHRKGLQVTEFGKQFCRVCVIPHDQKGLPKKGEG
jgi:abortive infection alpha-like protein